MFGGTAGEVNLNSSWLHSRGMWFAYLTGVAIVHFALLSIPFLSVPVVWTLTNLIHNMVQNFVLMRVLSFINLSFSCRVGDVYCFAYRERNALGNV